MKYSERKRLGAQKEYSQRRREDKLNGRIQKLQEENSVLRERLKELVANNFIEEHSEVLQEFADNEEETENDWEVTPYGEQK